MLGDPVKLHGSLIPEEKKYFKRLSETEHFKMFCF